MHTKLNIDCASSVSSISIMLKPYSDIKRKVKRRTFLAVFSLVAGAATVAPRPAVDADTDAAVSTRADGATRVVVRPTHALAVHHALLAALPPTAAVDDAPDGPRVPLLKQRRRLCQHVQSEAVLGRDAPDEHWTVV